MTMRAHLGHIKRRPMRIRAGVIILAAAGLLAASQAASAAPKDTVRVLDRATREPVRGAFSKLERSDRGIETRLRTRARPGHAHSLWYVIFNAPENCSDQGCGDDDIFTDPSDHS